MNILYGLGFFIFTVGIINLVRITAFSILSDYYDIKHSRAKKRSNYRPLVSVIVPAHNERAVLERCLLSIYESDYKNFEVIVVDDGSTDNTSKYGHYLRKKHDLKNLIVIKKRENGGKASALNYGIRKHAHGKIIVAMDADCVLDTKALKNGAGYFKNPAVNAVAANVKVMAATPILGTTQFIEYMLAYRMKKALSVLDIEYLAGCTSFFRRSAVDQAGLYDTDTVAEDFDFSLKLIRSTEGKILYAEDVLCYTEGVQGLKDLYRQRFRWRYGSFQAFYKNRRMFFSNKEQLSKFLTWVLLPWLLACEFLFILEPLLVSTMIYSAIRYHYLLALAYGFLLYGSMTAITALSDRYITVRQRLKVMFVAPVAYLLFMIINYVGYVSLVKSLFKAKGIKNRAESAHGWFSPARAKQ